MRGGRVVGLLEEVIVGVTATGDLADLSIPTELGVVALEGPESVRTQRIAPHLLRLVAPVLHRVQMLSELPIPLLRVLHQPQYQILREFHYESHYFPPLTCVHNIPQILILTLFLHYFISTRKKEKKMFSRQPNRSYSYDN